MTNDDRRLRDWHENLAIYSERLGDTVDVSRVLIVELGTRAFLQLREPTR